MPECSFHENYPLFRGSSDHHIDSIHTPLTGDKLMGPLKDTIDMQLITKDIKFNNYFQTKMLFGRENCLEFSSEASVLDE